MVNTELDFHKRIALLGRKHAEMAKGYVMRMRPDGLIVIHLKRPKPLRITPLKGLCALFVGFCLFKATMLLSIGEATYDARVAKLQNGTVMEQGGAWFMQVDPATAFVADLFQKLAA